MPLQDLINSLEKKYGKVEPFQTRGASAYGTELAKFIERGGPTFYEWEEDEIRRARDDVSQVLLGGERITNKTGEITAKEKAVRGDVRRVLPFSPFGLADTAAVASSANRLMNDTYAPTDIRQKQQDLQYVEDYFQRALEEKERGQTWGAFAGSIVAEMPAFVIEFIVSGGTAAFKKAASKEGAKQVAKALLKKGTRREAAKQVAKGGAKMLGRAATRMPYFQHRVAKDYLERRMPRVQMTDQGEIVGLEESEQSGVEAFFKAQGSMFIELLAEDAGELLNAGVDLGKTGVKGLTKNALQRSFISNAVDSLADRKSIKFVTRSMNKLADFWAKKTGGTRTQYWRKVLKEGGFNGVLGEIGEERLADAARAVTGIEDFGTDDTSITPSGVFKRLLGAWPSGKQITAEMAAFSMFPLSTVLLNSSVRGAEKVALIKSEKKAEMLTPTGAMVWASMNPDAAKMLAGNEPSRTTFKQLRDMGALPAERWTSEERQALKNTVVQAAQEVQQETQAAEAPGPAPAPPQTQKAPQEPTQAQPQAVEDEVQQEAAQKEDLPDTMEYGMQFQDIPTSVEAAKSFEGDPVSTQEIYDTLSKQWDIDIRSGGFRGKAEGIYRRFEQLSRIKSTTYGDISVAAHEVAHHIDNTLGIPDKFPRKHGTMFSQSTSGRVKQELKSLDYQPEKARPSEGFAEFVRLYLTNEALAMEQAPATYEWFQKEVLGRHKDIADKMAKTKAVYQRWLDQGQVNQVRAQVVTGGNVPVPADQSIVEDNINRGIDLMHKAYTRFKDALHPLSMISKEAQAKGFEGKTPYEYALAFDKTGPSLAYEAVMNGVMTFKPDGSIERTSPGLAEIFTDIAPEQQEDFDAYLIARQGLEMHQKGVNPGFSVQAAKATIEQLGNEAFELAAGKVTAFNNALLDMMVDAGVVEEGDASFLKDYWEKYVPFHRVQARGIVQRIKGGKGFVDGSKALKRRFGSGRLIQSPIESTVERAMTFYERAVQQVVTNNLIQMVKKTPGMGKYITNVTPKLKSIQVNALDLLQQIESETGIDFGELPAEVTRTMLNIYRTDYQTSQKKGAHPIVMVMEKGKPQLYEIGDQELYNALTSMDVMHMPKIFEVGLGYPTKLLKIGATAVSTGFAGRNLIRDYMIYLAQSKQKGADQLITPFEYIGKNIMSSFNQARGKKMDPYVELRKAFGGELSQVLGKDPKQVQQVAREVIGDSALRRVYNIVTDPFGAAEAADTPRKAFRKVKEFAGMVHPVQAAQSVVGFSEAGPRLAEFASVMQENGWTADRLRESMEKGEMPPLDVIVDAINASNDVTTNFKRMGTWGRYINRAIPFWNARLEGWDKMVRSARDNPLRMAMYVGNLVANSAFYWWLNKDEDWYKEAAPWLKYGFWVIKGPDGEPMFRIPRPFEYGWLVSALTEALLDQAYGSNPDAVSDWFKEVNPASPSGQFNPQLDPFNMLINIAAVKPMIEAFGSETGYSFFREREIVNQSLQRLETKDQYYRTTSEVAKAVGEATTKVPGTDGIAPAKIEHLLNAYSGGIYRRWSRDYGSIADIPFLGGLIIRSFPSRSLNEFYEEYEDALQAYNSAKKNDPDNIDPKLKQKYRLMQSASQRISQLRDSAIDGDKESYNAAKKEMIGVARQALGLEPLESYQASADPKEIGTRANALGMAKPTDQDDRKEWQENLDYSLEWMRQNDLSDKQIKQAYLEYLHDRYKTKETKRKYYRRFAKRLESL